MTTFRETIGRGVISRASAERIGTIRRLMVDPPTGRIPVLAVADAPRPLIVAPSPQAGISPELIASSIPSEVPILVDWSAIVGFGPDAVVIPSVETIRPPASEVERQFAAGDGDDLIGHRLLTSGGELLGKIGDIEFDEAEGHVTGVVVGDATIPVERFLAVGPYAVIIET